jgi:hypothetical protein
MLLLSASSKEKAIELLNSRFCSTTYDINENDKIVWKGGEVKTDLKYICKKGRHRIEQV